MYEKDWYCAGISDRASVLRACFRACCVRHELHGQLLARRACGRRCDRARKRGVRAGDADHASRGSRGGGRVAVHCLVGRRTDVRRGRELCRGGQRHIHGNLGRGLSGARFVYRYICARRTCGRRRRSSCRADRGGGHRDHASRSSRGGGKLGVRRLERRRTDICRRDKLYGGEQRHVHRSLERRDARSRNVYGHVRCKRRDGRERPRSDDRKPERRADQSACQYGGSDQRGLHVRRLVGNFRRRGDRWEIYCDGRCDALRRLDGKAVHGRARL